MKISRIFHCDVFTSGSPNFTRFHEIEVFMISRKDIVARVKYPSPWLTWEISAVNSVWVTSPGNPDTCAVKRCKSLSAGKRKASMKFRARETTRERARCRRTQRGIDARSRQWFVFQRYVSGKRAGVRKIGRPRLCHVFLPLCNRATR